jgi:hypothetical protein
MVIQPTLRNGTGLSVRTVNRATPGGWSFVEWLVNCGKPKQRHRPESACGRVVPLTKFLHFRRLP